MIEGENRYVALIEAIFLARYRPGDSEVSFGREELVSTAKSLGIELPKKLGASRPNKTSPSAANDSRR